MRDGKIVVAQQVLSPQGIGGVTAEFKALMNSSLTSKYIFKPVILTNIKSGISLSTIKFYLNEFKRIKPDIIHIRGAAIDGLNAVIAAKLYKKAKILVAVHGMYSDLVYISKLKRWIAKNIIEKWIFSWSDGISCVCEAATKKKVFTKYKKKLLPFVYNRKPSFYDKLSSLRANLRLKFNLNEDDIVGVFCGRITKEKGMEVLLNALNNLDLKENHKFLIVGDGNYLETFKNNLNPKIANNVICTGSVSNAYEYLVASDYFIMPSLHENHSIALLEALEARLPAIITDVGGNLEIYNESNAIIIHKQNVDELKNAINAFIHNSFTISISFDSTKFNNETIDNQLNNVYHLILNK